RTGPVFPRPDPLPYPLAVSPDSTRLAIPGQDENRRQIIDLWNLRTGKKEQALEGHRDLVTALAFSTDGWRLISGGADGIAIVWDLTAFSALASSKLDE